jgi:hypothetical protein
MYRESGASLQFFDDFFVRLKTNRPPSVETAIASPEDYSVTLEPPENGDFVVQVTIRPYFPMHPFGAALQLTVPLDAQRAPISLSFPVLGTASAWVGGFRVASYGDEKNDVAVVWVAYPAVTATAPLIIKLVSKKPFSVVQVEYRFRRQNGRSDSRPSVIPVTGRVESHVQ